MRGLISCLTLIFLLSRHSLVFSLSDQAIYVRDSFADAEPNAGPLDGSPTFEILSAREAGSETDADPSPPDPLPSLLRLLPRKEVAPCRIVRKNQRDRCRPEECAANPRVTCAPRTVQNWEQCAKWGFDREEACEDCRCRQPWGAKRRKKHNTGGVQAPKTPGTALSRTSPRLDQKKRKMGEPPENQWEAAVQDVVRVEGKKEKEERIKMEVGVGGDGERKSGRKKKQKVWIEE